MEKAAVDKVIMEQAPAGEIVNFIGAKVAPQSGVPMEAAGKLVADVGGGQTVVLGTLRAATDAEVSMLESAATAIVE
eukprot:7335849-Prymnesium_polylepis.1